MRRRSRRLSSVWKILTDCGEVSVLLPFRQSDARVLSASLVDCSILIHTL